MIKTNKYIPLFLTDILSLANGEQQDRKFNYTKFYTKSTLIYGFPTVMGFPGIYTLHTPVLSKQIGNLRNDDKNPHQANLRLTIDET